MAIQALRFAFSDADETFDRIINPMLKDLLITMLSDSGLGNRRLALTTLNAVTNSKPAMIIRLLPYLLPLVYRESRVNPDLIREVQMGPFKHRVDDGLENRKVWCLPKPPPPLGATKKKGRGIG
jgi:cullin-associated NEDD8-dissociated protein 1